MTTRTFTREELEDLHLPYEGWEVIKRDRIVHQARWHIEHELIFQLPDQPEDEAWSVVYFTGATEYQDQDLWDGQKTITARLMVLTPVTEMKWVAQ